MDAALFTETVSVKRLSNVGVTNKREYTTHIASLPCHIQPVDETISPDLVGSFGKDWLLMCATADLDEGDRVTWNAKEYRVTAVVSHNFAGEAHTEALIRIFES